MIFKSVHFPNEIVATRRGSPLLIGVKTPKKLKVDFVDVEFGGIAEESTFISLRTGWNGVHSSLHWIFAPLLSLPCFFGSPKKKKKSTIPLIYSTFFCNLLFFFSPRRG